MASGTYNRFKKNLMTKIIDLSADTIKVMLLNNSHSFNPDNNVKTDVNTNEITGTGYTADGVALGTLAVTQDDTNDLAYWTAANSTWTTATFTAYNAVIWDSAGSSSLICSIDFGGAKSVTAGTFTIQWAATGIVKLT